MPINYVARLIRNSDSVTYSAEFEAEDNVTSAIIAAVDQYGADNVINTIYPLDQSRRAMFASGVR